MSILDSLRGKKSLQKLEEETEYTEAENRLAENELSLAQKKAATARLKESGLSPKHFGFDWTKIMNWIKTH